MNVSTSIKNQRGQYTILKDLSRDHHCLVRREVDDAFLIASLFDLGAKPETRYLAAIMGREWGPEMVNNLLNHENLISVAGGMVDFEVSSDVEGRCFLLWDCCDAGSLDNMLQHPPVAPTDTGFLPESLCWHVLLSVLRALCWLHEGQRVDWSFDQTGNSDPFSGSGRSDAEEDEMKVRYTTTSYYTERIPWIPIQHGSISPANIHFQYPRRSETYGPCKLGNLEHCVVGHDISNDEPDLVALGRVLWRMMTGGHERLWNRCTYTHSWFRLDGCSDCGSASGPSGEEPNDYTRGLKLVVLTLLNSATFGTTTEECMVKALRAYSAWRKDSPDGQLYSDINDR
ncbi:uncharacterized protein E0L32_005348 [Thyridium curvatum]|uniref:Protein kinase domain-containing protein n=1 Tax=Thyridium curvatum TaxID=1093900 RepID=A0A507B6C9_9PEZI|nr:uncharacterized protein E0L32_005348 [Thyridium curvatum]TPX14656.1 hypothetical protein E0L32_005348 [Thyridium curvatum]